MKKFYLLFVFAFYGFFANAQNPDAFIMTLEISSGNLSINVPIVQNSTNNYTIDFGDGTILTNQTGNVSHTYSTAGIYTVSLTGVFKKLNGVGNRLKTIEQWGTNQWESMEQSFINCYNLTINATDTPDLSQVTNMRRMFFNAGDFNSNTSINNWDVSNVTDMREMFAQCQSFNQSLDNWDVSNVTNMYRMFHKSSYNQSLNDWDVSSVTNMEGMFGTSPFLSSYNQPLNNWDVSNVTNMKDLFYHNTEFNQPLNNWDVSNVTNMETMFYGAESFNQPIGNWDVSNVTNIINMFSGASSFNQSINNWDVSNITNMIGVFSKAESFNQPLNNWDVSNVISMARMFEGANLFNQPLDNWDVSNVTNMSHMFEGANSFNQPLNNWDVSNVIIMAFMFRGASSFNQSLDSWDVSNAENMGNVFANASSFNQDISNWNFNSYVAFTITTAGGYADGFLSESGLDTTNYDALLLRFAQLGLQNKILRSVGLNYCDIAVRNYLINELDWNITHDSLGESCEGNTISGNILFDENNNGCDSDDIQINNILVNADNGTPYYSTLSVNGEYTLNLLDDTYIVSLLNVPDYFIVTPESYPVSYTDFGNSEELNFCLTANQTIQDLNITILPINEARPGFGAGYQLIVQNIGTQTVNNVLVSLDFDNTMQSFVSAVPNPSSTTTNQLNFDIASLSPFGSTVINFTMQTFTPPTVNGDDILNFTATVNPNTDDYTPNDNTFELEQIVVNSYDPNDKQVLQGGEIYIDNVNEYLHYLIRFQNTGTASAIHVRIEDELHESLDWNTIQILNSSHNYRVEIKDGNQVEFIFNNINLPYEDEDEEGSNGFIAYKIKPVAGLEVGDIITGNEAYIYFDYNLPIITNSTETEIVQPTSSVSQYNLNNLISVYPNPTNGILHISSKENIIIEEVKIYNLQGRELFSFVQNSETINIQDLSAGIYLMSITTNQGSISKRVIKK